MISKCGAGKDSSESHGLKGDQELIPKEINPEYSLAGLILKLKLQYFGHLMRRADLLEKILMLGKIEGKRRREQQRMRWLDGIINSMDTNPLNLQPLSIIPAPKSYRLGSSVYAFTF